MVRHSTFCFFSWGSSKGFEVKKGPIDVQSVLSRFIHYEDKEARRAKGRRNRPPARSPCSAQYKKTTTPETTIVFSPLHSSFAEITEMFQQYFERFLRECSNLIYQRFQEQCNFTCNHMNIIGSLWTSCKVSCKLDDTLLTSVSFGEQREALQDV